MEASPKKGVSLGSPSLGGKTERKNVGKLVPDIWLPIDKRERERERGRIDNVKQKHAGLKKINVCKEFQTLRTYIHSIVRRYQLGKLKNRFFSFVKFQRCQMFKDLFKLQYVVWQIFNN
jgi:hypothetical protein